MIFRTKRGAGGYQDGLPGGFSLPGQAGADDLSGQNAAQAVIRTAYRGDSAGQDKPAQAQAVIRTAYRGDSAGQDKPAQAQAVIRTAYRGDSACQDKPAQMIFRTKRGGRFQDKAQFDMPGQSRGAYSGRLTGGFSLPGQSRGAGRFQDKAQMICQDKARRLFRTAYWGGDSACQDKPAQMIFRTKRGAGGYQDGLPGGFSLPGQGGAVRYARTKRGAYSGRLTGGFSLPGQSAAQAAFRRRRR